MRVVEGTSIADSDMPHKQKLLDAGYNFIEDLPAADDLQSISGIGKKSAEDIGSFLEKWMLNET